MLRLNDTTRRSFLASVFGIAGLGALPLPASATARKRSLGPAMAPFPANQIGVQLFTVRDLLEENMLGLEGTLELLQDVGISHIELAGTFMGHSPQALRELVEQHDIRIAGNHFGPRTMDGENRWYGEAGRAEIFAEAQALGLEFVGTGHYYNVPLTVEGFQQFAQNLNTWGAAASAAGLKFYYHNHDGEFTRFDDRPLFDILLEETDPEHVYFELDLGWAAIAGEDVYELVGQHQHRFPYFHVKDFWFNEEGSRPTKPDTLAAGQRFSFANVGKGQIDWPRLFAGLEDPSQHIYFIERDDAGNDEMEEGSSVRPTNPAGSANTVWTSFQYLSKLEF